MSQGQARKKASKERAEAIARRREALSQGNDKRYEEIAIEIMQSEENMTNEMLTEVLGKLGIDQREF